MTKVVQKEGLGFEKAFSAVREEVRSTLSSSPLIIRKYVEHLTKSEGKYIRAKALLLCSEDGNNIVPYNAVKLATAVELFHLATLIHDDVMDDADMRRGVETIQKRFGKKTAVICGDYLFSTAVRLASSIEDPKEYADLSLPDYITRICKGELYQHVYNGNLDISVHDYFKIISGKTAALFEACFHGGAILKGASERDVLRYKRLGYYIGMIFQITDDCLDFEESRKLAGKPVKSDFEQGVITLPLIYTLQQSPDFKRKLKKEDRVSRKEIDEEVKRCDGVLYAKECAERYRQKALMIIHSLDVTPEQKAALTELVDKAAYRRGRNGEK